MLAAAVCSCGERIDPERLLREALDRSGEASTLRADVRALAEPQEGSNIPPLSLEGVLEMDREGRSLRLQFNSFILEGELLIAGGEPYLQMGGSWYSLPRGRGAADYSELVRVVSDAIFSYPDILAEYTSVRSEGSERVAGRDCHKMAVSPDLTRLAELDAFKQAGGGLGASDRKSLEELQKMAPGIRVWVDKDNHFIRKLELTLELDLSQGALFMGMLRGRMNARVTAFFNDYGQPLEIIPPSETEPFDLGRIPFL